MFDPGALNRMVQIQQRTSVPDDIGQPQDVWVSVAAVWASIRQPRGLEAVRADKPASEVQTSIRVRYRTNVDAGMRVLHGASVYHVEAVLQDDAGRQWTDLVCKELG
jgi:SPP1 family predicted phage head-tail adaptor